MEITRRQQGRCPKLISRGGVQMKKLLTALLVMLTLGMLRTRRPADSELRRHYQLRDSPL